MKRILIVDDDEGIREGLCELLSERYEVLSSMDGEKALELVGREQVDLMVVDMLMPIMDGESLMRELTARGISLPVILISAHRDLGGRAHKMGASDFLPKPFDVERLEAKIERLLDKAGHGGSGAPQPSSNQVGGRSGAGGGDLSSKPIKRRARPLPVAQPSSAHC